MKQLRRGFLVSSIMLCLLSGCVVESNEAFGGPSALVAPAERDDPPTECGDPALHAAYEVTDASIHELVTCGGMQVRLAQNLVGLLLLSNDAMFDETTREQLATVQDFLPRNDFTMVETGTWRVSMGRGSSFDLTLHEPGGRLIVEDPFDMRSYLVGLTGTYEMTFDEMLADPEAKNRWEFTWDKPGPLFHLLNGGEPTPERFALELSLWELAALVYPDSFGGDPVELGPFASLFELEMASEIVFLDERGAGSVDYRVTTGRHAVGEIASSAGLPMKIEHLSAQSGGRELVATRSSLAYDGGIGSLSTHRRARTAKRSWMRVLRDAHGRKTPST